MGYLEHKGWFEHKGYVYGRTRSYSLLGSSISAFISIILVLNLPALRWLFIVCIIPYLIDFLLIASYPAYLDEKRDTDRTLKAFYSESIKQLKNVGQNKTLQKVLVSSATYDGVFKAIKDYIQPILNTLLLAAGIGAFMSLDGDQSLKVYLGIIYGVFYIFSSFASKNVYKLTKKLSSHRVFEVFFDVMGLLLLLLSFALRHAYMWIAIFYLLCYLFNERCQKTRLC